MIFHARSPLIHFVGVLVLLTTCMLVSVSYDIEKDGAKVAVLTFVKSAYRLGETILGVVDINFPRGRTKVLKASGPRVFPFIHAREA